MEDLLPNVEIENDETELLAENPINAYCVKLLRLEGCLLQQSLTSKEAKGISLVSSPGHPTLCSKFWGMKVATQEFGWSADLISTTGGTAQRA